MPKQNQNRQKAVFICEKNSLFNNVTEGSAAEPRARRTLLF